MEENKLSECEQTDLIYKKFTKLFLQKGYNPNHVVAALMLLMTHICIQESQTEIEFEELLIGMRSVFWEACGR